MMEIELVKESLKKKRKSITRSRFSDAPWFKNEERIKNSPLIIGGVGGIGSWTTFYLGRIGFEMYLYDNDMVEAVNLAGQLYGKKTINTSKVEATKAVIEEFSDSKNIHALKELYTEESPVTEYMISCFDNMKSRKIMFENWVSSLDEFSENSQPLFIDGRMEAEFAQVYFVTKDNIDRYRETLFDDKEIEDAPCSFKSTSHNGGMIGCQIVSGFLNHLCNIEYGTIYREVPFSIKYQLDLLKYECER